MRFSRWWSVAVAVAAACGGSTQDSDSLAAPAVTIEARQGETFRLRPGQTARLRGESLVIAFRGIAVDSRCPRDVTCVWQGDALARIGASTDGTDFEPFDLHTALEPMAVEFAGHTVRLVAVEPYPVSGEPIDPSRYIVTLRVD